MFGSRLRQLRNDHNLSLDGLAKLYNERFQGKLNKSTLSRYENGLQEPMISVVRNMAQLFDVSLDYLNVEVSGSSPLSAEAQKIAKAYDKATPKEQHMVRLTLSEYLDDDDQTVTLQAVARTGNGDSITETLKEHKSRKDATLRDAEQFGKTRLP